jgi:hypothetical protein
LEDTFYTSSRKICFLVNLKYQNGGKIQDGSQTIKCIKFVHNNANNWKLFNLACLKKSFLLPLFFFNWEGHRTKEKPN